jgi:hypothetical protein
LRDGFFTVLLAAFLAAFLVVFAAFAVFLRNAIVPRPPEAAFVVGKNLCANRPA